MDTPRIDSLEIRAPREEEFHHLVEISDIGFAEETTAEDEEVLRRSFPFERAVCAYDAGHMVGTLAAYSLELTVPGRVALPCGGETWGGTLPTHRRRGVLTALFRAQLADAMEREEPLSALMASEAGIYRRFGYGPATRIISFSIDRAYARFATPVPHAAPERMTLVADVEAAGTLAGIYESLRLNQPGEVSRPPKLWADYLRDRLIERQGATKMYHAVHSRPDGTKDGYVSYRLKEQWSASTPMYDVIVVELLAADPDAYKALWHYVIGTDLCQTISCWRARVDEPLPWLLADSRRLAVNAVADDLYVRLLDIPRALAGREYSASGELVLEVAERFPTVQTRRYLLESGGLGGGAACRPTDKQPDISLEIDGLGAAYLGGVSFTTLAQAGRAAAPDPRSLARADAMFSWGIAPFCSTMF